MLPERIGPYIVEGELGRGAMGQVLRARHAELGHAVAVKVLLPELADDLTLRARFEREAAVASRLADVPGVVGVRDQGADAGTVWFAMDLIEGQPLNDVLRDGDWSTEQTVDCFVALARALAAAHARGVLHRDLKPSNVMLRHDGTPLITDFGLARYTAAGPEVTQLTRSGQVLGTPAYMPLEQVRGQVVDERADIYALGATLYEALSGRPPFEGDTMLEIMAKVMRRVPPPLAGLRPDLPTPLTDIVTICLAKLPEDRYASAGELADDLERFRGGSTIHAKVVYRVEPGTKRALVVAAAGGAALTALIGAIVWSSADRTRTEAVRDDVRAEMTLADRARTYAAAATALEQRGAGVLRALQDVWHEAPAEASATARRLLELREVTDAVAAEFPDSRLPEAWSRLGAYFISAKRGVPESLEQWVQAQPEDPFPRLLLARVYLSLVAEGMQVPLQDRMTGNYHRVLVNIGPGPRAQLDRASELLEGLEADPVWAQLPHAAGLTAFIEGALALGGNEVGAAADPLSRSVDDPLFGDEARSLYAVALFLDRDYAGAAEQFRAVAQRGWYTATRNGATAWFEQSRLQRDGVAARRAHLEAARTMCDRGLQAWPGRAQLLWVRGAVLTKLAKVTDQQGGDPRALFEAALADLTPLIAQGMDTFPNALASRAILYDNWGAWEERRGTDARAMFELSLADTAAWAARTPTVRDPRELVARPAMMQVRLAVRTTLRGEDPARWATAAIASCDAWAQRWPDDGAAWSERARARMAVAEWEAMHRRFEPHAMAGAVADARTGAGKSPDQLTQQSTLHQLLGTMAEWMERNQQDAFDLRAEAVGVADQLVRLDPDRAGALTTRGGARSNFAQQLHRRGKDPAAMYRGAMEDLEEAAVLAPGVVLPRQFLATTRNAKAQWLQSRGLDPQVEFAAALVVFETLVQLEPENAALWLAKGGTGVNFASSERTLERDPTALLQQAVSDLETVTRLDPRDVKGWLFLGNAHWVQLMQNQSNGLSRLEPAEGAAAAWTEAVRLRPQLQRRVGATLGQARQVITLGR